MDVEVVAREIIQEDLSEALTGEEKHGKEKSKKEKSNSGVRKTMKKNTAWMHHAYSGFFLA